MHHTTPLAYRIVDSLFRYRLRFLLTLVGVAAVVGAALLNRDRSYVASASIRVVTNNQAAAVMGARNEYGWESPSGYNVRVLNDLLRDDVPGGFLDTALRSANLKDPVRFAPGVEDPRLRDLKKRLYTSTSSPGVFAIGLKWPDSRECESIVLAIQAQYIEEVGQSKQAASIATAKFLESEIAQYARRLRTAERALIDYKQANSGQLPDAMAAEMEQLNTLRSELDFLKITAEDSRLRREAIEARLAQIRPTTVAEQTVAAAGPTVSEQLMDGLKKQRGELLAKEYLPGSKRVAALDREIERLRGQVEAEKAERAEKARAAWGAAAGSATAAAGDGDVVETRLQENPEYAALTQQLTEVRITEQTQQARAQRLLAEVAKKEQHIRTLPVAESRLTDRTRDYDILKKQYEDLLNRREQAQIKANLERVAAVSALVPIGKVAAEPVMGQKKALLMLIGSAVLGLILAVASVVAGEWQDRSLRHPDDAERLLGLPLLAHLPDDPDNFAVLPAGPAAPLRVAGGAAAASAVAAAATMATAVAGTVAKDGTSL